MKLLDGKKVSQEIYTKLQGEVAALQKKNIIPRLALILVGEDPASLSYIKQKRKASEEIGIVTDFLQYQAEEVDTENLTAKIRSLNQDHKVHGILVQLPLPEHVSASEVIKAIEPHKDVDGFSAANVGKMFLGPEFEDLVPCTPMGIITLLEYYNIELAGKNVVVVGSSNIVGKPVAVMLSNRKATVTICNSKTKDLAAHTKKADILIVAVGKAKLITADMVKKGAVVVDVGTNRNKDGKLCGDVDFENVAPKCSYISPVPGGVGPMTVAGLMQNIVKAAERLALRK